MAPLNMLLLPLILWAAAALSLSLHEALVENDLNRFDEFLASEPRFELPPGTTDALIFATTDAGFEEGGGILDILARRKTVSKGEKEYCGAKGQPRRRRQLGLGLLESEETVYETYLTDPEWANLNGAGQVVVRKESSLSRTIVTGLYKSANIVQDDITFDQGTIVVIDRLFTLPDSLATTLTELGGPFQFFKEFMEKAGVLEFLNAMPTVTFLIPMSFMPPPTADPADFLLIVQQHILVDFPGYTSMLKDGGTYKTLAGTDVTVTIEDGSYFINGSRIVQSNMLLQNGVIHGIDRVSTTLFSFYISFVH
ncbi:hypothetical protein FQN52_002459 [Onygenales sp. PD_12]|nr:hypothetical protein FQN52_002459 [Onygenales sp. PD_12]